MRDEDIQTIIELTPALRRYARFLTRNNVDEADDLVQDTLERTLLHGDRLYKPGTNLKAWLMRILYNRFLDNQRKNASRSMNRHVTMDDVEIRAPGAPDQRTEMKEIVIAFDALPDLYKRALFLIAIEQLSYADASKVLGVAVGTVKSRVARARAILKDALEPESASEEGKTRRRERRWPEPRPDPRDRMLRAIGRDGL